ncbi:hypothetical protein BP6252_11929 [Coleophoma cylindrospora]|uniref:Methyltransferase n=1 Tax=Coleophoma cylindrospora TaxID=1849047 RepID=A0A3D8QFB4_9HELO|nr:hypothetical protein BP6252_11929 [Coleophoma cylindrospora]
MDTIHTTAHFLSPIDLYKTEKPYSLRFPPPDGFPRQSTKLEEHKIVVRDVRKSRPLSFAKEGCTVLRLDSRMKYDDYEEEQTIKDVYLSEVSHLLRQFFGATKVQIFEHRVRKRHVNFPIATGELYEYDQPTSVVHVDTTLDWVLSMVRRLNSEQAEGMLEGRVQCVNVWRPINGPVKDWPLALCSARTIDPVQDLEPCDLVYPDYVVENMQVYHRDQQQWFYMSDQMPDEAWVFLQADTKPEGVPVPHVAIPLPDIRSKNWPPRESIECRALVYYGANQKDGLNQVETGIVGTCYNDAERSGSRAHAKNPDFSV